MKNAGEMFRIFLEQQGMGNEAKIAAKQSYSFYSELKNAGFKEQQAMDILLTIIGGSIKR